ncbi:hypothetical protein BS47DRAFT_1346876 [Hydnum rufescens UP504]|uniref:Uncharacterized protein n=1 Tax=Hydnum rufescens UP504 TaxID=1448309 RepID=A0A9P6DQQ8_9AGAM|nr:hypothetical protein BS47DRAFT_1346876 [Hydnum rufescens UP504]
MAPKRPLGLAKTKKEKVSKRQRTDLQPEDGASAEQPEAGVGAPVDVTTDDWEDLKELFSRAQVALLDDPATALPLFRGQNPREPPTAFFALYADALIHSGHIIGINSEVALEGEPDSPLAYFEAALDIVESGAEKANAGSQSGDDWKLHYSWTKALVLLARAKITQPGISGAGAPSISTVSSSSTLAGQLRRTPGSSSEDLLSIAVEHYNIAVSHIPQNLPSRRDQGAEHDIPSIRTPSKSEICCTIGTLVFDVAELLPSSERRHHWTNWAVEAFEDSRRHLGLDELQVEYNLTKGHGRALLALLPDLLGEDFDEDPNILSLPEAPKARIEVENALSLFDRARVISSTLRPNSRENDDDEELHNLLCEALLYLANLTEDNETRDALFSRAREEGVTLSESGDESDEDG